MNKSLVNSKVFIVLLVLSLFSISHFSKAANECRLKFKSNNSGFQYKNVNKGRSINYTKSGFTDAFNIGRNDMRLTLEYFDILAQRNKTEYLYLIKSGNLTIPLPPIPLIGKKLKRIECKNFGTVVDAQSFVRQFGNSASSLVRTATTQATAAVTAAANNAANRFTSQAANTLKSSSQAAINLVNSKYNQAKRQASATSSKLKANMARDFPEVQSALSATGSYKWKLSDAVMRQGQQNITNTLAELNRIDKKYKVSQTTQSVLSVNLARDFPEINSVLNQKCEFNERALTTIGGEFSNIKSKMARLDKKYGLSKNASKLTKALIKIPSVDIRKVKALGQLKPCKQNWVQLTKRLESDRDAYFKYSSRLEKELKQIDKRLLTPSQRQFIVEIDKLNKYGIALNKEQKAQKKRKEAVSSAKLAHSAALDKIENDIGPIGDFLEKLPGGTFFIEPLAAAKAELPDWMTRDPARLKANLADAKRKGDAYSKAVSDYDSGFDKVQVKFDRWTKQIGVTLKLGLRLKVKLPNGSPLWKILKSAPKFTAPKAAFKTLTKCVQGTLNTAAAAYDVFDDVLSQYQTNIAKILAESVPKDVRKALIDVSLAIKRINDLGIAQVPSFSFATMKRNISAEIRDITKIMKDVSSDAAFPRRFDSAIKKLNKSWGKVNKTVRGNKKLVADIDAAIKNLVAKSAAFNKVIKKHANSNDMKQLTQSIDGFVGTTWSEAKKSAEASANCIVAFGPKIVAADKKFVSRLAIFLKGKVQVVANAMPAPLKKKLTLLLTDLNKAKREFVQFSSSVAEAGSAFSEFNSSKNQLIASLTPLPQASAPQKMQNVLSKGNALTKKMNTVNRKQSELASSSSKIYRDMQSFAKEIKKQSGELGAEATKLTFTAFDFSIVTQQANGLNSVLNKWNTAAQKLPERLASVATGGMSDQVKTQIERGIVQMNGKFTELSRCVTNAGSKRTSILSSQQRAQAINQSLSGLSAEATATIVSLNSLLVPSLNVLSKVNGVISNASKLATRLQTIGTSAGNKFKQNVTSLGRDLDSAKQCVMNKNNDILRQKAQLLGLMK